MAAHASDFASSTQEDMALGHGIHPRPALRARFAAQRDLQFFQQVAHSGERVTASLRSSITKVAESRVLIAKIDDLLRR